MEQTQRYEVEDLMREAGGLGATHRKSGVALETLRTGRRGIREWSPETRAKLARAWGVGVGEVRWPARESTGGTQSAHQTALAEPPDVAPIVVPDVEETRRRYRAGDFAGDFRTDEGVRAEIAALVARQHQLAREQQAIAEKLAAFGGQFAAQEQPKGN